jgi:hypothetical protein
MKPRVPAVAASCDCGAAGRWTAACPISGGTRRAIIWIVLYDLPPTPTASHSLRSVPHLTSPHPGWGGPKALRELLAFSTYGASTE